MKRKAVIKKVKFSQDKLYRLSQLSRISKVLRCPSFQIMKTKVEGLSFLQKEKLIWKNV